MMLASIQFAQLSSKVSSARRRNYRPYYSDSILFKIHDSQPPLKFLFYVAAVMQVRSYGEEFFCVQKNLF